MSNTPGKVKCINPNMLENYALNPYAEKYAPSERSVNIGPRMRAAITISTIRAGTILMLRFRRKLFRLSRWALPVIRNPLRAKNKGKMDA